MTFAGLHLNVGYFYYENFVNTVPTCNTGNYNENKSNRKSKATGTEESNCKRITGDNEYKSYR